MGQAFDRNGNVLGEAFGDTKHEVFEKLNQEFKNADRINVQTLRERREAAEQGGASVEMPRYRCHKEVWALKIADIRGPSNPDGNEDDDYMLLVPAEPGYAPLRVSRAYMDKHAPKVGGYFVVYKDGYRSFSPADVFEDGYTRL